MRWHEITIYTTEEATEAIADYLHQLGAGGVSIEESGSLERKRDTSLGQWYERPLNDIPEGEADMKGYFADAEDIDALVAEVKRFVAELPEFGIDPGKQQISFREVNEEDWANAWKQYYKPVRISDRLTVKPTWEVYEPGEGEVVVELDPGMAFGTGTHPTTSLCMQALEAAVEPGDEVIDVGTGSGVLAIAAVKLGASRALALDLDPVAVSSAKENVRLNGLEDVITVQKSDLLQALKQSGELGVSTPVRVVVANILAEIILTFIGDVRDALKPDGLFVASGIIESKREDVEKGLLEHGFEIVRVTVDQGWVVITARIRKEA
ncbi:50S ribosomal protein L11 methyltransferase [Paenibacillus turpanensis]|uniref:50S ribosomal protein L11 methyltransferase n=1 Tax=Paenibacillus turpanensis TaxID=2689078 RepID=UPI00140942D2|nr:50S ribosomal protein L11 methyltransferase [Paenibacillus turpanensis]